MRIEDLCSPRLPSLSPSLRPREPTGRLPALSALIAPREPVAPSEDETSLKVTIRIPSRNRARYEAETTKSATSTPLSTCPTPPAAVKTTESSSRSPVRHRSKRKRCEDSRKHESAQLLDELQDLETRLTQLKRRAGQEDTTPSSKSELSRSRGEMQLYIATLGGLLLQRVPQVVVAPVHTYIHLNCSLEDRQRTIMAVKPEQLRIGRQLVEQRSKFLDITNPHTTNEWYTTDEGDVCGIHFYVEQIKGCHDVAGAFSASVSYISSYEVSPRRTLSVMNYHDDKLEDSHSSTIQLRVLMTALNGLVIEVNSLLFTEFYPDENVGVIVANYVDKDDLRPYEPTKRVRQEITAVSVVSASPVGVVVRHWIFVRTRFAPHLLDASEFGPFARENQGHTGEDLVTYLRKQLLPEEATVHQ